MSKQPTADPAVDIDDDRDVDHDHAWRRVTGVEDAHLLVGVYRCDLCPATWSM